MGVGTSPRKGRELNPKPSCCLEPSGWRATAQRRHTGAATDRSNADKVPAKQANIIGDKVIRKQNKMLLCFIRFPNLPCLSGVGCTVVISSEEPPGLFGH